VQEKDSFSFLAEIPGTGIPHFLNFRTAAVQSMVTCPNRKFQIGRHHIHHHPHKLSSNILSRVCIGNASKYTATTQETASKHPLLQ
jgi:hypothetical protein